MFIMVLNMKNQESLELYQQGNNYTAFSQWNTVFQIKYGDFEN